MKIKLTYTAILVLSCTNLFGAEGKFEGEIRGGYQYGDVAGSSASEVGSSITIKYENNIFEHISFGSRVSAVAGDGKESEVDLFMPFFDSKNDGYGIVNELYIKGELGNSELTIGRMELDLPFVDSDDDYWGLIPNRYEAAIFTNNDIKDTKITLAHIRSWSGVDSPEPSKFNKVNSNNGMNILGIEYKASEKLGVKAFGYTAKDFLNMGYLEANFENETDLFEYSTTLQYALQDYDDGSKANILGAAFELALKNIPLGFNIAYNKNFNDGIADVFYGAGPFVTSMEHHTPAELEGKGDMLKAGISYDAKNILDGLNFEANYAKLNRADKADAGGVNLKIGYEYSDELGFKIVYSHCNDDLNDDMKNLRAYITNKF